MASSNSSSCQDNPRTERDLERLEFVLYPDAPSNLPSFVLTVVVVRDIRFAVPTRPFVTCGSTSLSVKGNWVRLHGSARQHCSACPSCDSQLPERAFIQAYRSRAAGHGGHLGVVSSEPKRTTGSHSVMITVTHLIRNMLGMV